MIVRFAKKLAKCCDFIDRVFLRFIGERLIFALVALIFAWVRYGIHKLKAGMNRDTSK
jgi:hypothetical protein